MSLQLPVASSTSPSPSPSCHHIQADGAPVRLSQHRRLNRNFKRSVSFTSPAHFLSQLKHQRRCPAVTVLSGGTEDTEVLEGIPAAENEDESEPEPEPTPDDLENIGQIKRVLELLKKNRDMLYGEVKLTVQIEDPREVERRRLLGIDDADAPSRDDLVAALEDVNEGRVPKNRVALKMLAEEMINWPNLEVEIKKTKSKRRSPYAKATDTGVDPTVAAKRLNVDWDTAAEIEEEEGSEDTEVPAALGYGALYLVTAFPVIIGISVVLILFYNSLQ